MVASQMLSPSLALVILVIATGFVALLALVWVIARGWISDEAIEDQSWSVFEGDELRTQRPWETPAQQAERIARFGTPVPPPPGGFGGAR